MARFTLVATRVASLFTDAQYFQELHIDTTRDAPNAKHALVMTVARQKQIASHGTKTFVVESRARQLFVTCSSRDLCDHKNMDESENGKNPTGSGSLGRSAAWPPDVASVTRKRIARASRPVNTPLPKSDPHFPYKLRFTRARAHTHTHTHTPTSHTRAHAHSLRTLTHSPTTHVYVHMHARTPHVHPLVLEIHQTVVCIQKARVKSLCYFCRANTMCFATDRILCGISNRTDTKQTFLARGHRAVSAHVRGTWTSA